MKKSVLLAIFLLCNVMLFAQHVPLGMKYQAVARDQKGIVLANKEISLRITLNSQSNSPTEPYYTETHHINTNKLGLFTLVLGEGQETKGAFSKVPWSTEDIWMEVSINDKGNNDFTVVSNSRLLAVPYAFHAATASQLVGGGSQRQDGSSSPSNNWITFGNSGTNPEADRLGTTDMADLVIITNNIERMRIYANGNIGIANDLTIGRDLYVNRYSFLKDSTVVYGPFTVQDQKPTLLSGSLTVDLATDLNSSLNVDGPTNLNSLLNVNYMSPTKLTGTLRVDGITDLNAALNVNNMATTTLSGRLIVQKPALFKDSVFLDDAAHQSYTPYDGALVVAGGLGLGGNLNVGGDAKFGGATEFAGAVSITDLTQSISTTTGALKVSGGVGIGKNLYVGQNSHLLGTLNVTGAAALANTLGVTGATSLASTLGVTGATSLANTLTVTGASQLNSTLGVTGIASLTNTTQSTSTATGALKVSGGVGIAKNLYVGGTMNVAGAVDMTGGLKVSKAAGTTGYVAEFTNTNNGNGISIKVDNSDPGNANNFISFLKDNGSVAGRVEGETNAQMLASPEYQKAIGDYDLSISLASIDVATASIGVILATTGVVAASTSSTVCVGFGACVTAPVPSLIIQAVAELAANIANLVSVAIGLSDAIDSKASFETYKASHRGVTYMSGAGDYAEWLPKENPGERFLPGSIVGVKNGKISLDTKGASQLMVISTKPFMLGNMPDEQNEKNFEKVAFMGQVPVIVAGHVKIGDYILPGGLDNGVGKAKHPNEMKVEDYGNIVGVAWSESNELMGTVNVAIGINQNELVHAVSKQDERISKLESQLEETNRLIASLSQGFTTNPSKTIANEKLPVLPKTSQAPVNSNDILQSTSGNIPAGNILHSTESDIVYYKVSRAEIEAGFKMAEKMFNESKQKMPDQYSFWKKYNSDASYRNSILTDTQEKLAHAIHMHKDINHEMAK